MGTGRKKEGRKMTYTERDEIFSKDFLSIGDLQTILGLTYQVAARLMRQIKFKYDRLGIQGKLHTEDYFAYFDITDKSRYVKEKERSL